MDDTELSKPSALVLASSSIYRKRLLERLQIPFETHPPHIDESTWPGETAYRLAQRLAITKSQALSDLTGDPLIIGSDQVAACDNRLLSKPGNAENAQEQLRFCSGKHTVFFTGVAVWRPRMEKLLTTVVTVEVNMRHLSNAEIDAYVTKDQPFDCAGSFRWESLGITLFNSIECEDPTALEGLPLIALCRFLRQHGYALP